MPTKYQLNLLILSGLSKGMSLSVSQLHAHCQLGLASRRVSIFDGAYLWFGMVNNIAVCHF